MRKLIGLLVLALGLLFATAAMAHDEAGQSADKAWSSCCGCADKCHKSCDSCGQRQCGCKSKCGSSCGHESSCGHSSCGSCQSKCGSCGSCHQSCGCKCCPKLPTEWPDPCRAGDPNSDWDRDGTSRRSA